jgi:hypothetical protein
MFLTGLQNRDAALGGGAAAFIGGYTGGASNGTATWASPQGPQTATQAGFGTTADPSGGTSRATMGVLSAGTLALAGLVWLWWSLPR